jgi:hypothetical protein
MCWKREWAAAFNNLSNAIIHVERAKAKLEKRAAARKATIEKLTKLPNKKHPELLAKANELYVKMKAGIMLCDDVITDLKHRQDELKNAIQAWGITINKEAKMTQSVMQGRRKKRMVGDPAKWNASKEVEN